MIRIIRVKAVNVLGLDHVSDIEQTGFVSYMVVTSDLKIKRSIRHTQAEY